MQNVGVQSGIDVYPKQRSEEKYLLFEVTRPNFSDRCFGFALIQLCTAEKSKLPNFSSFELEVVLDLLKV
jgi:hypothetical protein